MKSFIYILVISFFLCTGFKGLQGEYVKKGKDYQYSLTINKDSTFTLITQSIYARSGCKGNLTSGYGTNYAVTGSSNARGSSLCNAF